MEDSPAVEAVSLKKSFGSVAVLDDVSFVIATGSIFALLGRNGAGKTTTVRILSTLLRPDGGHATVLGLDTVSQQHDVRRVISITGQFPSVDGLQTGRENLQMMGLLSGLTGRQARDRAGELLEGFGLTQAASRRVATYSGGMRRRLDIAASLVAGPAVIFLDEPTSGLDLPSRQTLWEILGGLTRHGVTIFLTTQYLEEADQMADHIAVIDGGVIVADGTSSSLKERVGGHRLDIVAADQAAYDAVLAVLGPAALTHDRERLTVSASSDGTAASVRAILDRVDPDRSRVSSFTLQTATMDDVFLTLTGDAPRQDQIKQQDGAVHD